MLDIDVSRLLPATFIIFGIGLVLSGIFSDLVFVAGSRNWSFTLILTGVGCNLIIFGVLILLPLLGIT